MRKIAEAAVSGSRRLRVLLITQPLSEKRRSEATDIGGMHRYRCAKTASLEYHWQLASHHFNASYDSLITARSPKYLWNTSSAVGISGAPTVSCSPFISIAVKLDLIRLSVYWYNIPLIIASRCQSVVFPSRITCWRSQQGTSSG